MKTSPKTSRKTYHGPSWLKKLSHRAFPLGPRRLYVYLCCFGESGNWQWNCRLQKLFSVSNRTIRYWLSWLHKNNLIWIHNPRTKHRRIHPRYFATPEEWLGSLVFACTKKTLQKALHPATEFEAARQRNRQALLFGLSGQKIAHNKLMVPKGTTKNRSKTKANMTPEPAVLSSCLL